LATEALRLVRTIAPRYNALASLLEARAKSEAKTADARLRSDPESPLLCGIPYGVKDIYAARGAPTTWGSPMFRGQVLDTDADAVQRLSARGAVLIAKLALSELAGGGEPSRAGASLHGQGRNPWNPARYSGGSSSGSAITVALGLVPYALGTETGGSIVGPAAFTGITGLRPTYGTSSRVGVMTLAWSLDKVGPLARTAEDCATVLEAIADQPDQVRRAYSKATKAIAGRGRRSPCIAFSDAEIEEADPVLRSTVLAALAQFRGLFPRFVQVEIERDPRFIRALLEIVRVEGSYEFRDYLRKPGFQMTDAAQQSSLASGLDVPAVDYLEADRTIRAAAKAAFGRVFEKADVILSISRASKAQSLDAPRSPRNAALLADLLRAAANLAGIPGVSFPCGLSSEGLPVGLHLIGPEGSDCQLLAIAAAFQEATEHHLLKPPEHDARPVTDATPAPETGPIDAPNGHV
jgi:aspartyl-tRNA(Asn)/glutamyl-tRNA(Gln) amidotransferase subunit A